VVDDRRRVVPFPRGAADALELRHVRSFVAVAEELNYRRAAERLYISQPALSRQISAMERLVGAQLLRRSTHRVELTLAGEALLDRARRLLRDVDDAVHAVQSIGGEISARIMRLWQPVADHARDPTLDPTRDPDAPGAGDLQEQRAAYEAMLAHAAVPEGVAVRPVNAGGVPGLVVAPDRTMAPSVLHLHGGAHVFGSAFGFRPFAGALAVAAGRGVLVADYRLAPEHPFPAALDDAHAAYRWLLERGTDPADLVLVGDSTGAGLCLALLLRLRDGGEPLPGGAALLCPSVDASLSWLAGLDTDDRDRRAFAEIGRQGYDAYLAGHSPLDPLVSPLLGDLTGLPPLLIQGGTDDPLATDARTLHECASARGVHAELQMYPSDAHAFHLFWTFLPEAADAIEAAGAFIAVLAGSPARDADDTA
jgi:acetyl esterase/lipase